MNANGSDDASWIGSAGNLTEDPSGVAGAAAEPEPQLDTLAVVLTPHFWFSSAAYCRWIPAVRIPVPQIR